MGVFPCSVCKTEYPAHLTAFVYGRFLGPEEDLIDLKVFLSSKLYKAEDICDELKYLEMLGYSQIHRTTFVPRRDFDTKQNLSVSVTARTSSKNWNLIIDTYEKEHQLTDVLQKLNGCQLCKPQMDLPFEALSPMWSSSSRHKSSFRGCVRVKVGELICDSDSESGEDELPFIVGDVMMGDAFFLIHHSSDENTGKQKSAQESPNKLEGTVTIPSAEVASGSQRRKDRGKMFVSLHDFIQRSQTKAKNRRDVDVCASLQELALGAVPQIATNSDLSIWGDCPAISHKNYRKFATTVSLGESRILRAPDSDVLLSIPTDSPGVYCVAVHTEISNFVELIPDDECIVSPLVQGEYYALSTNPEDATPRGRCILRIPHCLHAAHLWPSLRVRRHQLVHDTYVTEELIQKKKNTDASSEYFEVDKSYISIYLSHFCDFIPTCKEQICQAKLKTLLYGRRDYFDEDDITTVDVNAFLCNYLSELKHARETLEKMPNNQGCTLVREVPVTKGAIDLQETKVKLTIRSVVPGWEPELPDDDILWDGTAFTLERKLSNLIKFTHGHYCKANADEPIQVMAMHACHQGVKPFFKGRFDFLLRCPEQESTSDIESGEDNLKLENIREQTYFRIPTEGQSSGTQASGVAVQNAESTAEASASSSAQSTDWLLTTRAEDMHEVFYLELAEETGTRWQRIGIYLNVDSNTLDRLKDENQGHIAECARKMFVTWRKSGNKTLGDLHNALEKAGEGQLASYLLEVAPEHIVKKPN